MLIVMLIMPPSFHVDDSANDIPARQVTDDDDSLDDDVEVDVAGVAGVVCVPLVLVVAVEEEEAVVTVLAVAVLATELDDEADPAEHAAELHSHVEAWEHEGEPPPPQGTLR